MIFGIEACYSSMIIDVHTSYLYDRHGAFMFDPNTNHMEAIRNILLPLHIIVGSISLILFWIPVIAKKGSKLHNMVGLWYVVMMTATVVSAGILCVNNIFFGHYPSAVFLGYLTVLSGYPLWHGFLILKNKKEFSNAYWIFRRTCNYILFLGAFGLVAYGLQLDPGSGSVLMFFAGIGFPGSLEIFKSLERIKKENNWLIEHLSGMVVSGIAAYTAFLAFGGKTMLHLDGYVIIIPWILPTVIGVIIIRLMKRKYAK